MRTIPALLACSLCARAGGVFSLATSFSSSDVRTELGNVHGSCRGGTCRYLNVPFAEPIAERFQPSRVRTSPYPSGGVGGSEWGPACMQFCGGEGALDVGSQSEDCLTLNIFKPSSSSSSSREPLPVMVFVYGGGFLMGGAAERDPSMDDPTAPRGTWNRTFDGSRLAAHGVVVVVIQYRLGIFGFLPRADGGGGANGLGDQLTSLQWVQRYVHNFGGDRGSVTLFGESSGSVSVCTLMHLPKAAGLFHRVIPQSGVCYPSVDIILTRTEGAERRGEYLAALRVTDADLRTLSARDIVNRTMAWQPDIVKLVISGIGQPSVDGVIVPDLPVNLRPLPVALLVGTTSADNPLPLPPDGLPNGSYAFFSRYVGAATARSILAEYGPHPDEGAVMLDACIRCQAAALAHRVARSGGAAHYYVYDWPHNNAGHSEDLLATFGTVTGPPQSVVSLVQYVWTEFAKGRDLSAAVPGWPRVRAGAPVRGMLLGEKREVVPVEHRACASWIPVLNSMGNVLANKMCFIQDLPW